MESNEKRKVKLDELQGWRSASEEEKKYIQGYLMDFATSMQTTDTTIGMMTLLISVLLIIVSIKDIYDLIPIAIVEMNLKNISMVMFALFVFGGLGIAFGKIAFYHLIKHPGRNYVEAVEDGRFRVLDVKVDEIIQIAGNYHGTGGRVSDMQGNQYEYTVRLYMDKVEPGILVDMISSDRCEVKEKVVLPYYHLENEVCKKGLKLYRNYLE